MKNKVMIFEAIRSVLPKYEYTCSVVVIAEDEARGRMMIMNGHESWRTPKSRIYSRVYSDEGREVWGQEQSTPCEIIGETDLDERIVCISGIGAM